MRWQTLMIVLLCLLALPLWAQEKRVTIELKDAPITDVLDQLFRAAGESFILEPGVPTAQRLTMRLVDVPFEKALKFVCDLADLRWEKKDEAYIVSRRVPKPRAFIYTFRAPPFLPEFWRLLDDLKAKRLTLKEFGRRVQELVGRVEVLRPGIMLVLSTCCPKCKELIRYDCPQCKRLMQLDFSFCPYDGTKLPPLPEKCLKCGASLPKIRLDTIRWEIRDIRRPIIFGFYPADDAADDEVAR